MACCFSAATGQVTRLNGSELRSFIKSGNHAGLSQALAAAGATKEDKLKLSELGQAPLQVACKLFQSKCVEVLLQNKFDAGVPDKDGVTPLLTFVRAAVAQPAAPESEKGKKQHDTMLLLLQHPARAKWMDTSDKSQDTPLLVAARNGHASLVYWQLEAGASLRHVDAQGANVLHLTVMAGHVSCLSDLLKAAIKAGSLKPLMAEQLLAAPGATPLMLAVSCAPALTMLLQHKELFDLDTTNALGENALHIALQAALVAGGLAEIQCAMDLLNSGICITVLDKHGYMSLQLAIDLAFKYSSSEAASILGGMVLGLGGVTVANAFDQLARCGSAAVHMAVRHSDIEMLMGLVQGRGAAVDSKDRDGNTPAIIAAKQGGDSCYELLSLLFGELAADPLCLGAEPTMDSAAWLMLRTFANQPEHQLELLSQLIHAPVLEETDRLLTEPATHSAHPAVPGPQPLLHAAAAQGLITAVREMLVEHQLPLSALNAAHDTLLHVAVSSYCYAESQGVKEVVAFLLEQGADPSILNAAGQHPLGIALAGGQLDLVLSMIRTNIPCVHLTAPSGASAVALAVQLGRADAVQELVGGFGAEIGHGLHSAMAHGHADVVQLLLTYLIPKGVQETLDVPDASGVRPVSYAWLEPPTPGHKGPLVPSKRTEAEVLVLVDLLVEGGATAQYLDTSGLTPLHRAVGCKHVAVMNQLALRQPQLDPNLADSEGLTPLGLAGRTGDLASIKALVDGFKLLDVRIEVPMQPKPLSMLHLAVTRGDVEVTAYLLHLPTVFLDQAAFHLALAHLEGGHAGSDTALALVDVLLTPAHLAASPDALSDLSQPVLWASGTAAGLPAMHTAALYDHTGIMRLLITRLAVDVDDEAADGSAALHVAVAAESLQAVQLLVDEGARVDQPSLAHNMASPLQLAVAQCDPDTLATLLASKQPFDVDAQDGDGRTAFSEAMTALLHECRGLPPPEASKVPVTRKLLATQRSTEPVPSKEEPPNQSSTGAQEDTSGLGGTAECVLLLLEAGADADRPLISGEDEDAVGGQPPLIAAIRLQAGPAFALLVQNKNSVLMNADNNTGRPAALEVAGKVVEDAYAQVLAAAAGIVAPAAAKEGVFAWVKKALGNTGGKPGTSDLAVAREDLLNKDPALATACGILRLLLELPTVDLCIPITAQGGNVLSLLAGTNTKYGYSQAASLLSSPTLLPESAQLLLNNQSTVDGQTALHLAVARNDGGAFVALLASQAFINYNLIDSRGLTPLALAVTRDAIPALQQLMSVARTNTTAFDPLQVCCEESADFTNSPMALAVGKPDTEMLVVLLSALIGSPCNTAADPRVQSEVAPPLSRAGSDWQTSTSGADPRKSGIFKGFSQYSASSQPAAPQECAYDLRAALDAPVDSDGRQPLQAALWLWKQDHVELLIKNGASLAVQEPVGGTMHCGVDTHLLSPMHFALLNLGHVQSLTNSSLFSPETDAEKKARYLIVMMSVQPSMTEAIALADGEGNTALHLAASQVCKIKRDLLTQLASLARTAGCLDSKNADGYSPLHKSLLANAVQVAEVLLRAGASISPDGTGKPAIELVKSPEMKKLLMAPPKVEMATSRLGENSPGVLGGLNQSIDNFFGRNKNDNTQTLEMSRKPSLNVEGGGEMTPKPSLNVEEDGKLPRKLDCGREEQKS